MNFSDLLKKYAIIIFFFFLVEAAIHLFKSFWIYDRVQDAASLNSLLRKDSTITIITTYGINIFISLIAIVDLKKFRSTFYLIAMIILLNKIIGVSLLLVYFLFLEKKKNHEINNEVPTK